LRTETPASSAVGQDGPGEVGHHRDVQGSQARAQAAVEVRGDRGGGGRAGQDGDLAVERRGQGRVVEVVDLVAVERPSIVRVSSGEGANTLTRGTPSLPSMPPAYPTDVGPMRACAARDGIRATVSGTMER
jgi:hypothetical protein